MQQDHNGNFGIHLDEYSLLANAMFSNYHQCLIQNRCILRLKFNIVLNEIRLLQIAFFPIVI